MHLSNTELRSLADIAFHLNRTSIAPRRAFGRILRTGYGGTMTPLRIRTVWEMVSRVAPRSYTREPIPANIRKRVMASTNCVICHRPFSKETRPVVDHLIPVKVGGVNTRRNLAAVCRRRNQEKGGELLEIEKYAKIWNIR